ncbi:leucine-rich PPR motif-containing protein, mitochondrial [Ostrinia nubilalis]|uniref:leucine-rich PPR motif-containing protein, mitochondrial n=1 Tax=Ostrinia nubilalis TaxID=29057 RepID=UPI0030822E8C
MSLLRSTKFVRYFTGAARTLILNTAKTTEVSTLINPKALSSANNVLMRDYATKKSENLEPLLQRLDSEVRRFGRITKRDIDEVFDELKGKNNITSSQSLLVIRCCGELVPEELPEQRTLLVQKIWNILTERGIPMDISHYNALLRVYIENEHLFSPAQFLEELESKGIQPNRVTYQRLMWRYCQQGDVEGATKVLEKMRELNFPVSEPVLNALVMGHAFHGDTDGAKAVLETMAGAGLEPTNHTYTLLACGYAKQGDINNVKKVIDTANNKEVFITDKDVLDIIEQLTLGGHGDKINQLFGYLKKNVGYNQEVCNLVLKLLNKGHIETAKAIMKTMPKSTTVDDTMFKGAFFVKQLIRINMDSEKLIKVCKELQEEELVPSALYIATEMSLQLGKTELAQKLFKEIQNEGMEIRQHYYWPLLVQKGKENDEEGLLQIVRTMSAEGLTPTGETLRDYVIPYLINNNSPQNIILKLQIANVPVMVSARNLMLEYLDAGKIQQASEVALQYRLRGQYAVLTRPLLNALGKTKDINSFVSILHVSSSNPQSSQEDDITNEDSSPEEKASVTEVGRLVKSGVKVLAKPELAEQLLSELHEKGLRISTQSAEEIQQYLDKNMTTGISELLTKLTSADLEPVMLESPKRAGPRTAAQLEKLIEQIKNRDGENNINRLQKQLLLAYINENNVSKVSSYLEELKASNFALSPALLAQLYEFYCQNDEIDKANACKADLALKAPEFELNKYKLVLMANALIRANRFDEAIQFLNDNKSKSADNETGFVLNSKCWQMLNALAEQKEDTKVLELTKALIENNYIEPSNVILGPTIKAFLLKGDVESALKQFENICKQYRCTPWKGELMKALIMKEDATKLQWLADLSTQIHGEVNILHDLVLAFVECGRLRQARRILETPGMHTRMRRLDDACQRYVEEGKSEYLEGLLEATKELSHIDRSNIFQHLLVTYCKADETDKAVGLWTILQEEGEIPSNQFLIHLGNHLKSKNRQVPFVMPDEPKTTKPKKQKVQQTQNIPSKNQISDRIEALVKQGEAVKAMDVALQALQRNSMPKLPVMKFLLKTLAEAGNVEKIEELGGLLTEQTKRKLAYDDKLTLAVFKQGAGADHIEGMVEKMQAAATEEDLEEILKKFPRSTALASIINNENLVTKCHKIAELAASKGHLTPINILWMEYLLAGKQKEANEIWNQWLCTAPSLLFRRLLQESHNNNDTKTIEHLLEMMKTNTSLTKGSLGNVYSRLINLYLVNNKVNEAESALRKAIEEGVQAEHFNKNCLERLKQVMTESGKEYNYFN